MDYNSSSPLRVVHLTTVADSLNLLLACEIDTIRNAGVEVIGMSGTGSSGQVDPDVLLKSLNRRIDIRSDLSLIRDLYGQLRRLRPDVLHTHTPKAGLYGRVVGRLARVPIVVNTCHGLIVPPTAPAWKRGVLTMVEGVAAMFSDAELYQSVADRDRLHRVVPGRKTQVVGNGTDLARFRFDPEMRRRARAGLGVSEDDLIVLGVGRRVRDKGIQEFCEAAANVTRPGVVCLWAGGAEPDKDDHVDVHTASVRMLGHVDDMPSLYQSADVFVLPSYREGFPRSAMEAAATGIPLVLSDIPGCHQLGDDIALFVQPKDAASLTLALERMINDPELRVRLSHVAQARAADAFDQRHVAAASLAIYRKVAERKRRIDVDRIPVLANPARCDLPIRFPE